MELRLDGKVALVTGGSRGIGRAIASCFSRAGAQVMIASRKEADLQAAVESMAAEGLDVGFHVANVGDPDEAQRCVAATVERFGALDILVNNAATNPYMGPVLEIDLPRAAKTVDVNLMAVVTWTQCAWRESMAARGGVVINMSSIGGLSVEPGIGWYNVTKAAVSHLTRQLAYELSPTVRVNALAPGLVKTDFARALWERHGDTVAARLPLGRLGEPQDIASAALFLASDASSWMTGQVLVIDGGAMASPSGGV